MSHCPHKIYIFVFTLCVFYYMYFVVDSRFVGTQTQAKGLISQRVMISPKE